MRRAVAQSAGASTPPSARGLSMLFESPELLASLMTRLRRGEHLVLYGPRGVGKSTLLAELEKRFVDLRVPCGRSSTTTSLESITHALERAYPTVETREVRRRTARWRLWSAADARAGVILLDHLGCVSNAMVSFLRRRLHGGVVGVLSAVDVDDERERAQMKPWRLGALSVRMPLASRRQVRRLLIARCRSLRLPPLHPDDEHRLVSASRGRPGWIVQCTALACDQRYWSHGRPLSSVLCMDAEALLRYGKLDLLRPAANAQRAS